MSRVQSFPPIVSQQSKLLILGSMPGEASLKASQYYAHPRNAFWHIMGELFGAGPSLPYQERVTILESVGVALWDSLQACVRPGSLDALIKEEVANDFPALFESIRTFLMCSSTAARRRGHFSVTPSRRYPKTATSLRACRRPALPMPRCDWRPKCRHGPSRRRSCFNYPANCDAQRVSKTFGESSASGGTAGGLPRARYKHN
jgi:TDG/mug DNA glycosylase family protein